MRSVFVRVLRIIIIIIIASVLVVAARGSCDVRSYENGDDSEGSSFQLPTFSLLDEMEHVPIGNTTLSFDSHNRVWSEFDRNWTENYPFLRLYYHVASYKRTREDESWRLLLVGGLSYGVILSDTWIYSHWSNSWLQISSADRPLTPTYARGHQVMPTVCETFVLLINHIEDVWYFNGWTETWTRIAVTAFTNFHYFYFPFEGVVSLRHPVDDESCNSSCCESVFVYGIDAHSPNKLMMYELKCEVFREYHLHCHWVGDIQPHDLFDKTEKNATTSAEPAEVRGLMAAADVDRGMIYFSTRCLELLFANDPIKIATVFVYDRQRRTLSHLASIPLSQDVCFYNIFIWNNSYLVLSGVKRLLAVSLKDSRSHALLKSPLFQVKIPTFYRSDVMLSMGPLIAARLHRIKQQANDPSFPHVSFYFAKVLKKDFPHFRKKIKRFPPLTDPGSLLYHTSVYDFGSKTFYLYGGRWCRDRIPGGNSFIGSVWKMTIKSKTWWQMKPFTTPNTHLSNCGTYSRSHMVLFGGQHENGTVVNELWLFNTIHRIWFQVQLDNHSHLLPAPRAGCSLTSVDSSTSSPIILFGGYSNNKIAKSDIWILDGVDFRWSIASSGSGDGKSRPYPRFGHSAAVVGNELIIYGGKGNLLNRTQAYACYFDMWAFSISNRTWRQVHAIPRRRLLSEQSLQTMYSCSSVLVSYGASRIVVWNNDFCPENVWMIDVLLKKRTDIVSFDKPFVSHAGGIWNSAVVYYGTAMESPNGTLLAIGKQCKPGAAQVEGPAASCVTCSIGKYHASIRGVAECLKCSMGTTTKKEGSRSVTDCVCEPDYCGHGSCEVSATDGAVCSCPFIFVGKRCNNINYFLIVLILGGLTVFVVVTTALVCCGLRTIRHRRSRRRTEKELEETRKAFTILSQEIELQGRLDEDCPGGYGQVHKARYRDWTVAVKQLQLVMMEWADIRREFLREIQFMRTVRHPNIVMFIGAGQYEEVQPFLVVEFMSGGALRSLLDNDDVQLTLSDQLRFVLDTAEGMKHLHMLDPPRIHRDLKSANLLLSEKRRVKVSDFGSARLIPRVNGNESRRANNREREDDMPLLSSSSHLTQRFIGTSRWRSPELWKKEIYGTATDVYRYTNIMQQYTYIYIHFLVTRVSRGPRLTVIIQLLQWNSRTNSHYCMSVTTHLLRSHYALAVLVFTETTRHSIERDNCM